ncbi:LuxR C-terminal-related transcriptional regulator [Streptoalloteichus hindustanus]|uniref:DNA-binding transcriptional regulator, CsgD family n=1 Tax=Streptoalloteichus hindustanus TaxID=2017 RepID=A0A1M5F6L2_STRHI|nr:LuxR C-terminal-related transcriptional regulator [Streptoalloteichus hindustanus]SHF87038.1 DNA-binding transcriptional regulator, CsgD family [Streptoalloteichus hindustanus]
MAADTGSVRRNLPEAARVALSVSELGAEISRQVGLVVPHDGYLAVGLDPLTGVGCFHTKEHAYSTAAARWMERTDALDNDVDPFFRLIRGPRQVGVLSEGSPEHRHSPRLHEIVIAEGFSSELRMALAVDGTAWGALVLIRERGRRPFSPDEAALAQDLVRPLASALRRFVGGKALRPGRLALPPGVVIVGADDTITSATDSGRRWLDELARDCATVDDELAGLLWNSANMARRADDAVTTRIPTPNGWVALHAEPLHPPATDAVAITIQTAPTALLLPAIAAWYGLTTREHAVLAEVVRGLPAKLIARRLQLSPHTVNDHLRATYRKTGVNSRDELLAGISG